MVAPRELRPCRLRRHPGGRLSSGPNLVPGAIAGDRKSEPEYESAVIVLSSLLLVYVRVERAMTRGDGHASPRRGGNSRRVM